MGNLEVCICGGEPMVEKGRDECGRTYEIACDNCTRGTNVYRDLESAIEDWNDIISEEKELVTKKVYAYA